MKRVAGHPPRAPATKTAPAAWIMTLIAVLGPLLGAGIGGGAVLIAQSLAIEAQTEQQQEQFAREQESAARAQRLPVYEDFQEVANVYATKSQSAHECKVAKVEFCEVRDADLQHARYRYQRAVNRMHAYGSPDAIAATILVSQSLPPSLVGLTGDPVVEPVDNGEFRSALVLFLDVMCMDLAEDPEFCMHNPRRELIDQLNQLDRANS